MGNTMSNWTKWTDIEAFNAWHDIVKLGLGIPNQDGITVNYTKPVIESDGIYALVESDVAAAYSDNLGVSSEVPESMKPSNYESSN
jgi:hypothetical protein